MLNVLHRRITIQYHFYR